jgi:hypothetical protein
LDKSFTVWYPKPSFSILWISGTWRTFICFIFDILSKYGMLRLVSPFSLPL